MKPYAQKDYPQPLGKSVDTIAESGAFLTALSNLLGRFDHDIDPKDLNNFFKIKGMDAAQLTLGAVTVYDPTIGINSVGAGVPEFSDSIVKLKYVSKLTQQEVSTYCLVDNIEQGTIIDSFDGLVKSWDVYGGPSSFVTFAKYKPVIITPLKAPAPAVEPSADTFNVTIHMNGYASLHDAIDHKDIIGIVNPGNYFIFDASGEAINITAEIGNPGLWINTLDIEAAKDQDVDGIIDEPKIETVVEPIIDLHEHDEIDTTSGIYETPNWQDTYKPGLNTIDAISIEDVIVKDLSGQLEDQSLLRGTQAVIAGKFEHDGVIYFRTKKSADNDSWYGIPQTSLRRIITTQEEEDRFDNIFNSIIDSEKMSGQDKIIKTAATLEGKARGLLRLKNKKG